MPTSWPLASSKCQGGLVLPVPTITLPRESTVCSRLAAEPCACASRISGEASALAATTAPVAPAAERPNTSRLRTPSCLVGRDIVTLPVVWLMAGGADRRDLACPERVPTLAARP